MPAETPTMKPRRSTADADIDALVAAADARRLCRSGDGMSFSSASRALGWYFQARERMSFPKPMSPRTHATGRGDERVMVQVDGGRGGDIDDVLATIVSIGQALSQLKTWDDQMHHLMVRRHRDGWSMDNMAQEMKVGPTKVSKLVHQGEMFMAGFLSGAGVIR